MIYTDWLPPDVAGSAKAEEPKRFTAAVNAFKRAADAAKADQGNPNAYAAVLGQLMDDIKTLVSTKTVFAPDSVTSLVYALYDVVLATATDVEVQVRAGELLNHMLRHYRHSQYLGLQLPWRPLYDMLRRLYDNPTPQLKGTFLEHVQQSTLFTLVCRARRFFPADSAQDIYALLRPDLVHGDVMSTSTHLALGWLVLFFPTKQLPATEPAVAHAWAGEWLGVWGRLVNCNYWDTHWMYLLARAVKDDWKGVVDWDPYVPELYTHMLACFKVPVGTATAGCPSSIAAPHRATQLFGTKLDQVDDQPKSAAKLAVHLLKQPQQVQQVTQQQGQLAGQAESAAPHVGSLDKALSLGLGQAGHSGGVQTQGILHSRGGDMLSVAMDTERNDTRASSGLGLGLGAGASIGVAGDGVAMSAAVASSADALDSLVQLLEQYCHPSNTGSWSGDLATFLRHGVHYFMKVLGRQCGSAGWPGEQVIVAAAARRYVRAAVKLAARGQFSKRDTLVSASCKALCHLSYVWPGAVLPLVLSRFQSALATATAMHQLPTAITTLALCVRPLLLAGWHTKEESTQQLIAEAMMAVLPGIDANDEAKTAAVFQFYTAVLSSIPALHGLAEEEEDATAYGMEGMEYGSSKSSSNGSKTQAVYRLPLYLDDWVDQVMERLFTLLGNLDTGPSHRSTDQQAKPELLLQSTHLGKDTLYHSFFQNLLLKLPPRLADHVVSLLGQFATERALPTVVLEAGSMFGVASAARPETAVDCIIKPLVAKIKGELPDAGSSRTLSRSAEDSLTWHLVLLRSTVRNLPPDVLQPLVPTLESLIDEALKLPSRVAHNWATMVLSAVFGVLTGWYIADKAWAAQGGLLLPNGLQLWIDRQGVGWTPPKWGLPADEHVAIAARLADKYLDNAAEQLVQLCSSSANTATAADQQDPLLFKTKCRALLASMAAVSIGLMSRLRDFEGFVAPSAAQVAAEDHNTPAATDDDDVDLAAAEAAAVTLQVVGHCGTPVGKPGVRNRAAAALTHAIKFLRGGDRELLEQASYTALLLMSPGMLEQAVGGQGRAGGKDDGAIIDEPAAATAYLLACSSTAADLAAGSSSSNTVGATADAFVNALMQEEQRVHDEAAAERAAAATTTAANEAGSSSSSGKPAAGSWGSDWRWRRRTSPLAVIDRIQRMLLWRCAQAAARSGPAINANGVSRVTPAEAAAGTLTPADCAKLEQLPQEYISLFLELLVLSMQPNAGVRGSAMPTLLACTKRFPCLVELMVPEVLAALAGVPGPLLGPGKGLGVGLGAGPAVTPVNDAAATVQRLSKEDLQTFYCVTLLDAMKHQQVDTAAASDAGQQQQHQQPAAAAAAAAMLAAAAKAAAGSNGNGNAAAAKAAAAAALAAAASSSAGGAAAAAAAGGGRSVAEESANDGRVAGACAVLTGCLDAWRVIFRDALVFRGFLHALMASRCHTSNTCLKSMQMLMMQVISRFKLPPLLYVDSDEFRQMQQALMAIAEPGARVTWRYAVLSNMVLMFAAPPASSAAAVPLLQHCLALLRSDMLLLRQVGGAGLWLLAAQLAYHGVTNDALLDQLKQALSEPDVGEMFVKLLVLDHAKLDASEAAKNARGGGGGLGGAGGLLSGLLGMTAEEVLAAMVAAAVERCDRWPREAGRPTATTDGLFEVSHARLVRLLALLCPEQVTAALQQPLSTRVAQNPAPSGPQEKAEVAAVAEALAGLLAAAAPSAVTSSSNSWAVELLKDALVSTTLEMSDAWSAALWYIVDHLLSDVMSDQGNGQAAAAAMSADAVDVEAVVGAKSGSAAAVMLDQVLSAVRAAIRGAAAGGGEAAAAAGQQGSGALPSDLKRLKYLIHCLPPIRRHGTLGSTPLQTILAAMAGKPSEPAATAADGSTSAAAVTAAAAAARATYNNGYKQVPALDGDMPMQVRLPKSCRMFLAALMHEVSSMLEVEQPSAVKECLGSLLGDMAGLFSVPAPLLLPASAAHAAAAASDAVTGNEHTGRNGSSSSGCSSPVEIEVPAAAPAGGSRTAAESSLAPEVVLLNSSLLGLRAQAAQLLQQAVQRFAVHAAQLESLKNSGATVSASSSSSNLAAVQQQQQQQAVRLSDNSDDVVMVDAADVPSSTGGATVLQANLPGQQQNRALGTPGLTESPDSLALSVTHCSVGLQMLIAAIESGESAALRPLLGALLPGVLQLQELSGPGLQQLASEAKAAFVLYKYVPFGAAHVKGVSGVVLGAGGSDAWSSRAAAVVFLQVFWFRHCYLLDTQDLEHLQSFVVGRLQDHKVEVRSLAAATLSGIIKALPASEIDILRQQMLSQVQRLFTSQSSGSKRTRGSSRPGAMPVVAAAAVQQSDAAAVAFQQQQGPVFLSEAQAVVQGLKAFVLSSPYDVPAWMPEVLMALVAAANSRNPLVRRDASKALSEFKRTHEEDALDQLRSMLSEEQWEAMTQVTSSASYFV